MLMERNSFIDANEELSQQIYRMFHSGSVINHHEYLESQARFVESPLYIEMRQNEDHYQQLYRALGYDLHHDDKGEFLSLKSIFEAESDDAVFDETTLKLMAILTLFCRLVTQRGQSLASLGEPVQGVTKKDLSELDSSNTVTAILKAMKLKSAGDAMEFVRKRGFAFRVSPNRFVLSKGAVDMINTLVEREKQLSGSFQT